MNHGESTIPNIVYAGNAANDASCGVLSFAHDAELCNDYHKRWSVPGGEKHKVRRLRQHVVKWLMWGMWIASLYANGFFFYASYQDCVIVIGVATPLFVYATCGIVLALLHFVKWVFWLKGEQSTVKRKPEVDRSLRYQIMTSAGLLLALVQAVFTMVVVENFVSNISHIQDCEILEQALYLQLVQFGLFVTWLCLIFISAFVTSASLQEDMLDHETLRQRIDSSETTLADDEREEFEKELWRLQNPD